MSADARRGRLCRDLQLDAFLHRRAASYGPRRPTTAWAASPAARLRPVGAEARHPGLREAFFADRRLWCGRGLYARTFAGLVPVKVVDGRTIGDGDASKRPVIESLRGLYKTLVTLAHADRHRRMSIATDQIRREDRANGGRYSYRFADGSEAEMIYVNDRPDIAIITHTYTPLQHRGQGVAGQIVAHAVADFRRDNRKVVPSCWFARQEFSTHPEWAELVSEDKTFKGHLL